MADFHTAPALTRRVALITGVSRRIGKACDVDLVDYH
jgi:NAD(P)-dependent dehydrogenase (short-subunit alcohol dehydrogenase family)